MGSTKNTLQYRDEEHGGLPYYLDDKGNTIILGSHNHQAPDDRRVYHDGMILIGVKELRGNDGVLILDGDGEKQYVENDIIIPSYLYYRSFISDMSEYFQSDALYKNDYIKLREISIGYTLPKRWSETVKMQKITVSFIARNLFYLYKTLPNVDAESILGTKGQNTFHEQSFLPTIRTYGFGVNVSF